MEKLSPKINRDTGKTTQQTHKRQMWLQILMPLIFFFILAVVGIIFAVLSTSGALEKTGQFASIALIVIVLPTLLMLFLALTLLVGINFGINKLINIIPMYSLKFQTHFYKIIIALVQATKSITNPIITTRSRVSGFKNGVNPNKNID